MRLTGLKAWWRRADDDVRIAMGCLLAAVVLMLGALWVAGCGPVPPPKPPTPHHTTESRTEAIHLGVPACAVTLLQDGQVVGTVTSDADGYTPFVVTMQYVDGQAAPGTLNLAARATCLNVPRCRSGSPNRSERSARG